MLRPQQPASGRDVKPADINDPNGPTVALSYNSSTPAKNPTASFMYFVPAYRSDPC